MHTNKRDLAKMIGKSYDYFYAIKRTSPDKYEAMGGDNMTLKTVVDYQKRATKVKEFAIKLTTLMNKYHSYYTIENFLKTNYKIKLYLKNLAPIVNSDPLSLHYDTVVKYEEIIERLEKTVFYNILKTMEWLEQFSNVLILYTDICMKQRFDILCSINGYTVGIVFIKDKSEERKFEKKIKLCKQLNDIGGFGYIFTDYKQAIKELGQNFFTKEALWKFGNQTFLFLLMLKILR